jgi:hypothetical protein
MEQRNEYSNNNQAGLYYAIYSTGRDSVGEQFEDKQV